MDDLLRYYGTDWVGILLTSICLYRLGAQQRDGFLYGALSNVAWGAFSLLAASLPTFAANLAFLLLNLRGWLRWREPVTAPR